jgi:hypothetical protein
METFRGEPSRNGVAIMYNVHIMADNSHCCFRGGRSQMGFEMEPWSLVLQIENKIEAELEEGTIPYHMLSLVTSGGSELQSRKRLVDYGDEVRA